MASRSVVRRRHRRMTSPRPVAAGDWSFALSDAVWLLGSVMAGKSGRVGHVEDARSLKQARFKRLELLDQRDVGGVGLHVHSSLLSQAAVHVQEISSQRTGDSGRVQLRG